ncbi:MAG: PKD domain-containing protein, partial [Terriglobales bacterium]
IQVVRDTCLGATGPCTPSTVVVESTNDGNLPDSDIYYFGAISGDGTVVAFDTDSTNILTNPSGYYSSDVYLASSGFAPSGLGPDLSVSISTATVPVVQGNSFGYAVTVSNVGGNGATSVTLTDTLPSQVTFVSATPSQGTCSGTTTITCALGSLASGTSAVVNITVTAANIGSAINTASVSAAESELNTANNSATATVTIVPPVTVAVSPLNATVHLGATQQFTATVTNATNTSVTWTATAGTIDASGFFTAPASVGSVTVTATSVADPSRTASATVNVIGISDLVVTNAFSVSGGSPTYTATVTNSGPSPASSVSLRITLDRFTFVSYTNASGGCSFSAPVLTCSIGSLALSGNKSVSVAVDAPTGGWASLTSSASALEYDPNPANNSAQISPTDQIYNTSAGANISVLAADGTENATVDFANVSAPGSTSLKTLPLTTPPPAGFRSGAAAVYYDVATSATYTGMIQLSFQFPAGAFHHPSKVRLFHMENGVWVDRTMAVNAAVGAVSGATTSLSPFALFEPVDAIPVANGGADTLVSGALSSGATVMLDGSASTDADGDALTYRWSGPFAEGATVTGVRPNVTLPFGASKVTLIVNDGEQDSSPVTLNVTVSDFAVAATNPAATVTAGTAASYAISLAPRFGAFNAPVTLSCTDLSAGMSCSFSPATLTPGSGGASSTLTLSTSATIASNTGPTRRPAGWNVVALMLAPFGFISIGAAATRRRRWILALTIAALMALAACGGGSMTSNSTSTSTTHPSVTKTVVVTATSAGVAHSTSVSVTVQ